MSIVGTFPSTLQNGTLEDATQVMALFSYIQSQVNGNACPATTTNAILKGNGSGGTSPAVAGTDYQAPIPPGTGADYFGGSVPSGWLLCDGSAISRTTYAALFAAISTTWGVGDGSTTFNLPDMRRRTAIGSGGTAVSGPANTLGATGGEETHVLTTAELATHNHGVTDPGHATTLNDPQHSHNMLPGFALSARVGVSGGATSGVFSDGGAPNTALASTGITANIASTGITINNNGSNTAHNNMQPSAVVTKIIKT